MLVQDADQKRGLGLFTRKHYGTGDVLLSIDSGRFVRNPDKYTVQLGLDLHLDTTDLDLAHTNHCCNPNTKITFDGHELLLHAIRDIKIGEECTFNYLTTEYDLHAPFECNCQSAECYGTIKGYLHLSEAQQRDLEPLTLPYLRQS